MYLSWTSLLRLAEEANRRIDKKGWVYAESGDKQALTSIVMSVIALEAFVSDLVKIISDVAHLCPKEIRGIPVILQETESLRGSLRLKTMLIYQALKGSPYDPSKPPFQDFHVLTDLRNDIVHYKGYEKQKKDTGGKYETVEPKILRRLQAKKLLHNGNAPSDVQNYFWVHEICTFEIAEWACRTARDIIVTILDAVPTCWPKIVMAGPIPEWPPEYADRLKRYGEDLKAQWEAHPETIP